MFCSQQLLLLIVALLVLPVSEVRAGEPTSQPSRKPNDTIVSLTSKAADEVKGIAAGQKRVRYWLRVGVRHDAQTNTFSYTLEIVDAAPDREKDDVYISNGVPVVVDHKSAIYLMGATIDFRDDATGTGFVFQNPNAVEK